MEFDFTGSALVHSEDFDDESNPDDEPGHFFVIGAWMPRWLATGRWRPEMRFG